jgi:hypothetical protein
VTTYDSIPELQKLGYTDREAAFLYLAGLHSGYFLRRQFLAFVEREDGAMVQRFLVKAVSLGHVVPIEYAAGRHIYHLKSKLAYRLLGQEDSQNRRAKGDREIKTRLMQVDYLLDHFGEKFLETAADKVRFFREKLKVKTESLPQASYRSHGTPCYFPDRFPIAVTEKPDQAAPLVTLVFLDDGLRSLSAFLRWLKDYNPLLNALQLAEVVYVSDSNRNFEGAEREFLRKFPRKAAGKELPMGLEHFLLWLSVRSGFDKGEARLKPEGVRLLNEGDRLYTSLEMQALLAAWKRGSTNEAKIRARFECDMRQISIQGYLLEHDYPVWSMKYRRSVL